MKTAKKIRKWQSPKKFGGPYTPIEIINTILGKVRTQSNITNESRKVLVFCFRNKKIKDPFVIKIKDINIQDNTFTENVGTSSSKLCSILSK